MFVKMIKKIQYIIIRIIENYPSINTIILNNINYFKLFLPHDKDYLGLKILFSDKNIFNGVFIDVGGNTGSSILSFRSMGFQNEIYSFEPNLILFQKYLRLRYFLHKPQNILIILLLLNKQCQFRIRLVLNFSFDCWFKIAEESASARVLFI